MKPKKKTDCDFVVKAVIIGDSGVGKTNVLLRYCDNCFKPTYSSTIGVDFKVKTLQVEEYKIKLQIWDTAGQEKFKNLSTTFYKGALIIILTYAIDQATSFTNVENWIKQIHEHSSPEVSIFLVGNKSDLNENRKVQL
jgi:Ras-related protein Rab-8A